MRRISIQRIVIDANLIGTADTERLREELQNELQTLLASATLTLTPQNKTAVDGGEISSLSGKDLPRSIAEGVVRFLGGKA